MLLRTTISCCGTLSSSGRQKKKTKKKKKKLFWSSCFPVTCLCVCFFVFLFGCCCQLSEDLCSFVLFLVCFVCFEAGRACPWEYRFVIFEPLAV